VTFTALVVEVTAEEVDPLADALLDALGASFTLFCPAFPEAGRTIYKGYLFVGDVLLSESGMRDHPLTPMRDPSLVRVLGRQSQGRVGLVQHRTVAQGAGRAPALPETVHAVATHAWPPHERGDRVPGVGGHLARGGVVAGDDQGVGT